MKKISYILSFILCLIVINNLWAQDEFMIYGTIKIQGYKSDSTIIKIESDKEQFGRTIILDSTGEFKIWLPYSKTYTVTFSKKEYQTVPIAVSTILPENVKKCCFTPFEVSFHMFKPDGIHDSLFSKPIVTIRYEQTLKSYFYSLDMDYYIQKMYIKAEMEHNTKVKDIAYMTKHKDSLTLEKKYMKLINSGNLYYSMKQFEMARRMFEKALELKPKRKYAAYKLEDIETQVKIFNKPQEKLPANADSIIAAAMTDIIDTKPKIEYKRKTDNEIEELFKQDLIKQIESETKNQRELAKRLQFVKNEVIDKKDFPSIIDTLNRPVIVKKDTTNKPIEIALNTTRDTVVMTKADSLPTNSNSFPLPDTISKPKIIAQAVDTSKKEIVMPLVIADSTKKTVKEFPEKNTIAEIKPFDKRAYQDSLKKVYPNEKTIEKIVEPYKTITRVIINRDNIVTIYIQVEHKWGGLFYFKDNTPYPLENISKSFFEVSTKLSSEKNQDTTPVKQLSVQTKQNSSNQGNSTTVTNRQKSADKQSKSINKKQTKPIIKKQSGSATKTPSK